MCERLKLEREAENSGAEKGGAAKHTMLSENMSFRLTTRKKKAKNKESCLFVRPQLARIRPDPNRHQAWDDLGLGSRRSGVLPSHSRANGSLPIP